MTDTVLIEERFHGPPGSANGGYACGLAARFVDGPAEVTLRSPPPLDTPLEVRRSEEGVALFDGETLVATARPSRVDVEVPPPVSLGVARDASTRYPWYEQHAYPTCFVCGPRAAEGDGMRIFPGTVEGERRYAAPWVPRADLAGPQGTVRDEFVWAALDCPSGTATDQFSEVGMMLLGRLSAELHAPVTAGTPHVVQAWAIERDGRKLHTASALFTADGELCAKARAVWIELAPS